MHAVYFAYGSNLLSARMRARVPSARAAGVGRLCGYRLTTDKAGRDGTAKANLRRDAETSVWGVIWRLEAADWPRLDAVEGGYRRIGVSLDLGAAETYLSTVYTADPVLAQGYKELLVDGAREHGLPAEWIAHLEALPAR